MFAVVKTCCAEVMLSRAARQQTLHLAKRHQLSLYDAFICAPAQGVEAEELSIEDLQSGLSLGPVQVRNPFN